MNPEEEIVSILKKAGVSQVLSLPCDRTKNLHYLLSKEFAHVPITREEEGVGIAAGAAIAGERSAILIQSSGIGNMINAIASLTMFYELPLFLIVSWRGVYKEAIAAQRPMGKHVPGLLKTLGIRFEEINEKEDITKMGELALSAFRDGRVTGALLSPKLWEGDTSEASQFESGRRAVTMQVFEGREAVATHTRHEILKGIKEGLRGKAVVSNLGVPCKELYHVLHQPSNLYMLGSMGMATPIGLGMAMATNKEVVVIDGDGSLLMNPGTLATAALTNPDNLTILAIDNGVHGSTGNQPTATQATVDLEMVARGMGIKNTSRSSLPEEIEEAMGRGVGPRFVHIIAKPGNATVNNIPLSPQDIKANVMRFLRDGN